MSSFYRQAGVNVPLGNKFSAYAGRKCRETHEHPFVRVLDYSRGRFRGPKTYSFDLPRGFQEMIATDGIGTKVGLITAALTHELAAHDAYAMPGGDIVRYGGLPAIFSSVLDVATLGQSEHSNTYIQFTKAIDGLVAVAREQNIVLLGGETAELGAFVGSENPDATTKFNWAGFCIGVTYQPKLIDGSKVRARQRVLALREKGAFRSNGVSAVHRALAMKFGVRGKNNLWWANPEAKPYITLAAQPSTIYDALLTRANGWGKTGLVSMDPVIPVTAHAHVTGGGIVEKFGADILLPSGLSAVLDNLWDPPLIMSLCREWSGMNLRETYETWNGGQGWLTVTESCNVADFQAMGSEEGIEVKDCGEIIETPGGKSPTLSILSKYPGSDKSEVLEWSFD